VEEEGTPPSPLEPGEIRRVTFRRSHTLYSSEEELGILRFISANNLYITWTEPHQRVAWDEWLAMAASWRFLREAGPTGEEYHGTGSFIHWVAHTIAIAPG
jgi:hypothetical protein